MPWRKNSSQMFFVTLMWGSAATSNALFPSIQVLFMTQRNTNKMKFLAGRHYWRFKLDASWLWGCLPPYTLCRASLAYTTGCQTAFKLWVWNISLDIAKYPTGNIIITTWEILFCRLREVPVETELGSHPRSITVGSKWSYFFSAFYFPVYKM